MSDSEIFPASGAKPSGAGDSHTSLPIRPDAGLHRAKINACWYHMKGRCYDPKNNRYYRYGARGITVCEPWLNNFEDFLRWALAAGWSPKLQIDRIDNDLGYSPENCRFVTPSENSKNRESTEATRGRQKKLASAYLLHKDRIVKERGCPVICCELGLVAGSHKEMARLLNVSRGNLSSVANGKRKSTKNLTFKNI